MALYHKQLRSLDDLEREQKALRKEMERMDSDESLSMGGLGGMLGKGKGGKKKKDDDESSGPLSSVIDMLPISSPVTMGLLKLVTDRIINRRGKRDDRGYARYEEQQQPKHTVAGTVRKAAVEVLGGYLKWKAIELTYKGVKHLVKKRKEKRDHEASLKYPSDK